MILATAPTAVTWLVLVLAALCAGFAKTAVGSIGLISVVLAATVIPAAQSTAAVLLLLIPVPSAIGTCGMVPFRARSAWMWPGACRPTAVDLGIYVSRPRRG